MVCNQRAMKIWITGIAGFLGSHLADALIAQGHEIGGNDSLVCGDISNSPIKGWSKNQTSTDCTDFELMYADIDTFKPDVLIHCAATAHEGLSSFSPSFITRNVYEASVATFSAAIASGVKRIVYMSSMSRYGVGLPPFNEKNHTKPVDPYGIAKVAAEDTLRVLCETHGVKWAIAVPHNIIGTRQKYDDPMRNVASIMINRCLKGQAPIIYGDGQQVRSFSPVKDCLPSLIKMVDGVADGEIINIGPDSGEITIEVLANKIAKLTGYKGKFEYFPDRPNEVKQAYCSSDKARRILGYKPQQNIDDCLQEMVEYIKLHGTKEFDYSFPIEIITERTPRTWLDKLI